MLEKEVANYMGASPMFLFEFFLNGPTETTLRFSENWSYKKNYISRTKAHMVKKALESLFNTAIVQ